MQPSAVQPSVGTPSTQEMIDAARVAAAAVSGLQQNQQAISQNMSGFGSGYTSFGSPNQPVYPEIALFSQLGQLGLFPQYGNTLNANRQGDDSHDVKGLDKATRSSDSRNSSAYASRHQAAEQRRRTRINERLELLRKIVPHAERANTACFLEEVIKYIDSLKKRIADLEVQLCAKGKSCNGEPGLQGLLQGTGHQALSMAMQPPSLAGSLAQMPGLPQGLNSAQLLEAALLANSANHRSLLALASDPSVSRTLTQELKLETSVPSPLLQYGSGILSGVNSVPLGPPPVMSQTPPGSLSSAPLPSNLQVLSQSLGLQTVGPITAVNPTDTPPGGLNPGLGGSRTPLAQGSMSSLSPAIPDGSPPAALDLRRAMPGCGDSPVSSEESGVPLKKRKMLVL